VYLNVIPSSNCSLHNIRVPDKLRKNLNLDFGDWLIFETSIGNFAVTIVDTLFEDVLQYGSDVVFISPDSPVLYKGGTGEVFIDRHQITLGADPEFFILNKSNRKIIEANKLFSYESQIGSDGDLGEIRPDYTLSPEQLVENIRNLIRTLSQKLPRYTEPLATSWYANRCCGFHVHIGIPIELLSYAAEKTDTFLKCLVTALDYFVGIPAASLDPCDTRRLSREYGRPGDYKLSMRTLEYRTPGGFHLKVPKYTYSLLSTSFSVVEKIISDAEEASGNWEDMKEVAVYSYFRNKYDIPEQQYINNILINTNRQMLEQESKIVHRKLQEIMLVQENSVITHRQKKEGSLYREWLENEAQY